MKKSLFILSFACMGVMGGYAQDDVYFVPNGHENVKAASGSSYQKIDANDESAWYEGRSSGRNVDEYNRRNGKYRSSDSIYYKNKDMDSDGEYTSRIVRFHSPRLVIIDSPFYWDFYDTYMYDPWFTPSWYWTSSWGWGYRYGWYDPWYSWRWRGYYGYYDPFYSAYWGWGDPWWNYYTWTPGPRGWRDTNRGGWGGRRDFSARGNSVVNTNMRGSFNDRRVYSDRMAVGNNRSFGNHNDNRVNNRSFDNRSFDRSQQSTRQYVPQTNTAPQRSFGQPMGGFSNGGRSFGNSGGGFSTGGGRSFGGGGGGRTFGR